MEYGIPVSLDTPMGTISFNVEQAGGLNYRLGGFNLAASRRYSADANPGRDGSLVSDVYAAGFTAVLTGTIKTQANSDRATMMQTLRAYCRSIMRADGTLRWTPTGQPERAITVRQSDDVQFGDGGGILKTFQVGLISKDSVARSTSTVSVDSPALGSGAGAGTIVFPIVFPIGFGAGSSAGDVLTTNQGDVETYPKVYLFGPTSATTTILHATTGKKIVYTAAVNAGDYVVFDMNEQTALLNGSSANSKVGSIDWTQSEFFPLLAGLNEIKLSTSNGADTGFVRVVFAHAYA